MVTYFICLSIKAFLKMSFIGFNNLIFWFSIASYHTVDLFIKFLSTWAPTILEKGCELKNLIPSYILNSTMKPFLFKKRM